MRLGLDAVVAAVSPAGSVYGQAVEVSHSVGQPPANDSDLLVPWNTTVHNIIGSQDASRAFGNT